MKHLGRVHKKTFKHVHAFQIELEFGSGGFWGEGKTRVTGEKPLGARERTNNKLKPYTAFIVFSLTYSNQKWLTFKLFLYFADVDTEIQLSLKPERLLFQSKPKSNTETRYRDNVV